MSRGRPKGSKNKELKSLPKEVVKELIKTPPLVHATIPLSKESQEKLEQGLKEAKEGKIEPLDKEQQERKERLNATLRDINKNMGKDTVKYANTMEERTRIPFKQKCLNKLTGGGIVKGLYSTFWGSKGCAKTTVVLDLIAEAQKAGNQCVYINGERSYDPIYAKKRGVNVDTLIVVDAEQLEDGLDIIIKLCKAMAADLIIFDSIHGLAPKAELVAGKAEKDKSTSDANMALRARALTQFFEMGTAFVSNAKCAIVFIAQSRIDLSGFIKLEHLTGGHALMHNSRLILRLRRGQGADAPSEKRETEDVDEKGKKVKETVKLGFDLVIHVDKSQVQGCTELDEIHVPFYYSEGIVED